MNWQILVTLAVLGAVIAALAYLRSNPDVVLLGGVTALIVTGILPPDDALHGFANKGLVTVAFLFVVAEGIRQTGALSFIGQRLLGNPKTLKSAQLRITIPAALMSTVLNNTPVVVMAVPIIGDWARKFRLSVSYLLLPLSYATILGGLCTLIGTSTTIVLNGLLIEEAKLRPLGMFEIAWVGIPATLFGLVYMVACTSLLLRARKPAITPLDDLREYTVEMLVDPACPLVGKTIQNAGLRHLPGMYLVEIDRGGHVLAAVSPNERLQPNDRLVFAGIVESVVDLQKIPGLNPATDQLFKLDSPRSQRCLVEAVVSNSCPFIGMTIREARFRTHYNAAVIAVGRNGERIDRKVGDIALRPGDTLLVEAHPSFIELQRNSRDFFLVSRVENSTPPRHERAWIARLILLVMVASVTFGLLSMLVAAMLAAGLMVMTRCCHSSEARNSIDWSVVLVIGAGLGMGKGLEQSGAADWLAQSLINTIGNNRMAAMAAIYFITMVLTNLITAKAAATLIFPVTVATAKNLGVDFMPFMIALVFASAASFATPHGYQTNQMVQGPGGYRFIDYIRFGMPLSLIVWAVTMAVIPFVWAF